MHLLLCSENINQKTRLSRFNWLCIQISNQEALLEVEFGRFDPKNRTARQAGYGGAGYGGGGGGGDYQNQNSPLDPTVTGTPVQTECPGKPIFMHLITLLGRSRILHYLLLPSSSVLHINFAKYIEYRCLPVLRKFYLFVRFICHVWCKHFSTSMSLCGNKQVPYSDKIIWKFVKLSLYFYMKFSRNFRLLHSGSTGSAWTFRYAGLSWPTWTGWTSWLARTYAKPDVPEIRHSRASAVSPLP